jgi:hypothetical protein
VRYGAKGQKAVKKDEKFLIIHLENQIICRIFVPETKQIRK